MKTITVLIIDDEAPALQRNERLVLADKDFSIAGTCVNGEEALQILTDKKIDLLLLDIEMPVMSGLSLLQNFGIQNRPLVVFITAYDEYAVTAFEYYAIDYLLKPFTNERFEKMLARVKDHFRKEKHENISWADVNYSVQQRKLPGNRLAVKTGKKYHFIEPSQKAYVVADGNYCHIKLHSGEKYVHRETLSNLAAILSEDVFMRIHHSSIIAINAVKQVNRLGYGEMEVCMNDNSVLKVSRKYKERVKKLFK
ncbi:MAG: LytTR family DNA-binding domain-containing protein [Bacteroidota bacterium]